MKIELIIVMLVAAILVFAFLVLTATPAGKSQPPAADQPGSAPTVSIYDNASALMPPQQPLAPGICGNSFCEPPLENATNCPQDCTYANPCESAPPTEINIIIYPQLYSHIHPHLAITILGKDQAIPAEIGIPGGNVYRPLHTHDTSGILHVESGCPRAYTLGDFFLVWGKNFNSTCIFDYCNDGKHTLKMYVDGVQNYDFGGLVLADGQNIVLRYE